jgi:hypothetical protein
MASAILRTIRPENYTVIDVRALESLSVSKTDGYVNDYLSICGLFAGYLRACCELASKRNVGLGTLDRPLWQWSKENGGSQQVMRLT